ncbi:uncharacterized protein METZ01_LOCUS247829 [marine metagenome]|uniref:Uncharacterized protein n=1 Tax=marine metagenome TaxID=408172 RepID=A0A382I6E4_9ZZZZ
MGVNFMRMAVAMNADAYLQEKRGGEAKTAQSINGLNNKTVYITSRR